MNSESKQFPLFTVVSTIFWLASPLFAWLAANLWSFSDDALGYKGLELAIIVLLGSLFVGLIAGLVAVARSESTRVLALILILLNLLSVVAVIVMSPG